MICVLFVRSRAQKRGKARRAFAGEAAVFISDGAADFGRVFTLCVFKARADAKFAQLVFARQRAEHARIFAFAFMVLRGALYLLPFVLKAPWLYRMFCVLALAYAVVMPFCLWRLGKKTNLYHALWFAIPLAVASYFTGHLQYHERKQQNNVFGRDNFFYGKSQFDLYGRSKAFIQMTANDVDSVFSPLQFDHASRLLIQPPAAKNPCTTKSSTPSAKEMA